MATVIDMVRRSAERPRVLVLRILVAALALLFAVAFVLVVSGSTAFNLVPWLTSDWRPAITGVLMGAGAAAIVVVALRRSKVRVRSLAASRVGWWSFVAACLAAQLVLAHAVLRFTTWDAMQIFEVAYHTAVAPEPRLFSVGDQAAYFALYPNNAFLVAVFAVFFAVLKVLGLQGIDQYLWASVVVNCLALTGSLVLARTVVRRIAPGFATTVTVVLGVLLVILSPWLNVAYSDSLAMPFPIAMLAIWLAWPTDRSWRSTVLLFALLGLLGAIGYAIKPPTVFIAIALLVATATAGAAGRSPRTLLRAALVGGAPLAIVFGFFHFAIAGATDLMVPLARSHGMPFAHYLAMGATGDGGFSVTDFNRTFALPEGERSSAAFHLWESRVLAMGPIGYPLFLAEKMLYAFSDGSFFQDREGIGPYSLAFLPTDPFSVAVQSVFPLGAPQHRFLASLWQAAWWSTVLLCFVPLRRLRLRLPAGSGVAAMRVAVLLLLGFLCFSESRSRYLYHYLPILLVLAGLGSAALVAELRALRERVGRRRPEVTARPFAELTAAAEDAPDLVATTSTR